MNLSRFKYLYLKAERTSLMNIVTYKQTEFVNKFMNNLITLDSMLKNMHMDNTKGLSNYMSMIEGVDIATNDLAVNIIKTFIEKTDQDFRDNPKRLETYHVKSKHQRTIMTIFGPLTFERTFYVNKRTKESYVYVDDFFGFERYERFDLHVKSLVIEACCEMSMAKAARKVSDMIGCRTSKGVKDANISRQSARTFVRNFTLQSPLPKRKDKTPAILFIMLDEKYIPLQRENKKDAMVHHAVVFEDAKLVKGHTKRKELIQKHSFSSISLHELHAKVLDYVYEVYDSERIKNMYVLGDGAGWIKKAVEEYAMEGCEVKFALDRYHFLNAMRLIFLDKDKEDTALEMILSDDRKSFLSMCDEVLLERPDRSVIITEKYRYVLNNWEAIRLCYHKNLKCCMEGQISHDIAAVLAVRPGAYSLKTLNNLIRLRTGFRNKIDIKKMYLESYSQNRTNQNVSTYDFSIFDMFVPKDTYQLGNPSNINFLSGGYA